MGTVYCLVLLCLRLNEVCPGINGCFVCDSCPLLLYFVYFFVLSLVFFINVYFCKYVSNSGNIQSMNNQLGQDENGTNYVFNI